MDSSNITSSVCTVLDTESGTGIVDRDCYQRSASGLIYQNVREFESLLHGQLAAVVRGHPQCVSVGSAMKNHPELHPIDLHNVSSDHQRDASVLHLC